MRIFVTGREGQVARSLAALSGRGDDVELGFFGRPGVDLSTPGSLGAAIREWRPDVVINAAAYTAVDAAETAESAAMRINAEAAGEGVVAAADVGARFIQLSTDYVFDGSLGRPYRESDATAPVNAYGRTKLAGEEQVRAAGGHYRIVRTSWVVSPFGTNFVKTMLRLATDRDELNVVADQRGCPTSAPDLAQALLALAALPFEGGDTLHLTGGGEASWAELAAEVFTHSADRGGPSAKVHPIATSAYPTPARRPADTRLDGTYARERYGLSLPDWRESVERIVDRLLAGTGC